MALTASSAFELGVTTITWQSGPAARAARNTSMPLCPSSSMPVSTMS